MIDLLELTVGFLGHTEHFVIVNKRSTTPAANVKAFMTAIKDCLPSDDYTVMPLASKEDLEFLMGVTPVKEMKL